PAVSGASVCTPSLHDALPISPPGEWFEGFMPDWAAPGDEVELPSAAGFSATDEDSLAAGCDPDPDPEKWAGYERYVPENLLGIEDRKSTRLNSSHVKNSYAVF